MKNKRGIFFGLYLVALTIFMIGVVITLYLTEQKDVNGLLVSPVSVLSVRDSLEVFEMKEDEIAKEVYLEVGSSDSVKFKKSFLDKIELDDKMKEFLLKDLDKFDVSKGGYRNFLEDKVYNGNFDFKDGNMIIKRLTLTKKIDLRALNWNNEIRFPVTFYFDFAREFKVNELGVR